MSIVRKYLSILAAFFKVGAISEFEFRMNVITKIAVDFIWYATQLTVFEVIFAHTDSISGWTLERTRVFMGVMFVVDALWMLLFSENLEHLSEKVRRGDLDLLLVKPVNSQFMVSLQKLSPVYLGNLVLVVGWLAWALADLPEPVPLSRLLVLVIMIPCALTITYAMRFFFSASALIFTRAENINYLWYQFHRLGTRPDAIYPRWLRTLVLTALPIGFMASVPSRLILDGPDPVLIGGGVFLSAILLWLTNRFWNFGLRHYSSASS